MATKVVKTFLSQAVTHKELFDDPRIESCNCNEEFCGVKMVCGGCGTNKVTARVLRNTPIIVIQCDACELTIDMYKLQSGTN